MGAHLVRLTASLPAPAGAEGRVLLGPWLRISRRLGLPDSGKQDPRNKPCFQKAGSLD